MGNRDYLNKLLALCTEKQADIFRRMYQDGPSIKQLSHAIRQVENTLKNLNHTGEDLKLAQKNAEEAKIKAGEEISTLTRKMNDISRELDDATALSERLRSPIATANNEIQERLNLLDALEAGGVDNWANYDDAIENYKD